MSLKKLNIKSLFATMVLLVLLFSASFAFFTNANLNSSVSTSIDSASKLAFTLKGGANLTLNVDATSLVQNGTSYQSQTVSTDYVQLSNSSATSNITCSYEIWYTPKTVYQKSSTNTSNALEFELIGTDSTGQNTTFTKDLTALTSATKIKDGTISVTSSNPSVKQMWSFTVKHYNLSVDQSSQYGKSYSGQITFKAGTCN